MKTSSRKASKIAQDEIGAGLIAYTITEVPKAPLVAATEFFDGGSR